jgi:hypothetical protein
METGTATDTAVLIGHQHFHPGHPKCWAVATVSGGTPTLQTSYNITSITDTATGRLTVTIATDFSSANWCCVESVENTGTGDPEANNAVGHYVDNGKAAGSVILCCFDGDVDTSASDLVDPTSWSMAGFGDQA